MRFGNYGRKSVFSDKSDSIDNQFRMSREHCEMRFPGQIESWEEYSDEDFTGSNTERPDLQRLLQDVKDGMLDVLIVYQLDRLSRDVRDFSNIYALLEEHNVMFISIRENIDTTTPIGRAMMYVTVVFAQMERETIAARVTDNMLGLAKKGYWTSGNPPYGYVRQRIEVEGKKHVTIVPDPEGVKYHEWIVDTFLDNGYSLNGMQTAFKNQGIKTISGKFFSTTQLHKILTMPYCVEATPEIYDYYEKKGCKMDPDSPREKWDGTYGVMIYGRSSEKTNKHLIQPPTEWTVCLGKHKPFMKADKWLTIQERFNQNKFDKTMKYDVPLLKGTLRCSCGSIMQVSRKKKNVGVTSHYYCLKRMKYGVEECDRSMIKCEILEEKVLQVFREIESDPKAIMKYTKSSKAKKKATPKKNYKQQIASLEAQIGRLAASIATNGNSTAVQYIIAEMERLDASKITLKREQAIVLSEERMMKKYERSAEEKAAEIGRFIRELDNFSAEEKNEIVKKVVKECVWDGETLF